MRIVWSEVGTRFYESGVDRGVLYPKNGLAMPWNGLISVKEAPTDSEGSSFYLDGIKHQNQQLRGSFAATISAFTYPNELEDEVGPFNFSYRTKIGNDVDDISHGYKLHLVYNSQLTPFLVDRKTENESVEPVIFSWGLSTTPISIVRNRSSAHLIIDSTKVYSGVMEDFEDLIYGTDEVDPIFPTVEEVLIFFEERALIIITDHGDGSWSAEGPAELIEMLDADTFQINSDGAVFIDTESYTIETW